MQDPALGFSDNFPVTADFEGGTGPFVVDVHLTLSEPARAPAVQSIFKYFEIAGSAGMFNGTFSASAGPTPASSVNMARSWRVGRFQLGALRLLLNMLAALHREHPCIGGVRIIGSPTGSGLRVDLGSILAAHYPARPPQLPFTFLCNQRMDDVREPALRYQFNGILQDMQVSALAGWLRSWTAIVALGAFGSGIPEAQAPVALAELLNSQQIYRTAPTTIEHLFYEFEGPATAFELLLNLGAYLDRQWGGSLVSIELD